MSQWGQAQPQYPLQTGYNPQFQQGFGGGIAPQQTGFPVQRPQGFLQSQPTGFPGQQGFQQQQQPGFQQQPPQQAGFQQPQQAGFQQPQFQPPQQTGFQGAGFQQRPAPPPVPSLPTQFQQQGSSFLGAQQPSQFLSNSTGLGGPGLAPQPTGFPGASGLPSNFGGGPARPLVPQATGYVDPRLTMMSNTFMPANPALPYSGGAPQFQPQTGPSLQQNFQQHNQTQKGTTTQNISWTLSKAEKKNYDQIFRAWDASGSGFISGQTALEVFGQSGLDKNELARVWALADSDNRGKLNLAEFHVAMGLIYRRLNGNQIPDELPEEMVPPSARDLNSSVDLVKEILKNDTRSAGYNSPVSKMRERSFNSSGALGAGGRQDATIYKHNDTGDGVYTPRSRHVDRSTVRVNNDDPVEDLSVMKKQLENTARLLDRAAEENASRTREDEELEREMEDLRYRIKRLQDDLDYVSRGPRSFAKDEERRKLERDLVHLMHEKLPSLEKRIEENQVRKDKEKREQMRDRDRRNERSGRFGDRDERDNYSASRYGNEDGRYSRGAYDQDRHSERSRDRDFDDRDRDYGRDDSYRRSYDGERDRDRDRDRSRDHGRPRSPPAARTPPPPPPPAPSSSSISKPPSAPAPTASPAGNTSKMTPEERKAHINAEAQKRMQDRMRALGVHSSPTPAPTSEFSDVEARLAQEKKEAEEKAKAAEKAEEERIRLRQERLASEKALKEGVGSSVVSPPATRAAEPAPVPPKPAPTTPKARAPVPPPPRKPPAPKSPIATRSLAPRPAPVVPTPPAAQALVRNKAPAPQAPEVDLEEERIRAREVELQKKREAREARIRELEKQEEEEAKAVELQLEQRRQALAARRSPAQTEEAELQKKREAREARIRELEKQEEEEAKAVELQLEQRRQALAARRSPAPPEEEAELQKKREAMEARIRELEKQEEEEARAVELQLEQRRQALAAKRSPAPPEVSTPVPVPPPAPLVPVSAPVLEVAAPPAGKPASTNPFSRLLGDGAITAAAATSAPVLAVPAAANGSTNPFFRSQTAPPGERSAPNSSTPVPAIKASYHTAPSNSDDEWDQVVEKDDDESSEDEFTGSREKRKGLAEKFFGNILPPARPQSAGLVSGNSQPGTPVHSSAASVPFAPPSPPPAPPISFGTSDVPPPPGPPPPPPAPIPPPAAATGDRSALLGAIQGGSRLKKAVTNDRSGTGLAGRVLGGDAPPTLSAAPRPVSSPIKITQTPEMMKNESLPTVANGNGHAHKGSVDWYAGLAADQGHREMEVSLPAMEEEDEPEPTPLAVPQIQFMSAHDPLEDVDRSIEYRVRSLYPYEGQRVEDLSFAENLILTAHPSISGGDWWYGTGIRDGKSGFFPQTYVARIQQIKAKALYSYPSNNADELPFSEGDELTVIDRSEEDWWKVEQSGLVFIAPAAYLEVVEDAGAQFRQVEASYTPRNPLPESVLPHEQATEVEPTSDDNFSDSDTDTGSEYLSFSESEDEADGETEEQQSLERERQARETERQRVLEAAGLIVKKDEHRPPPRIPRHANSRRPPPAVPDQSSIASGLSKKDLPSLPVEGDEDDNAIRLDDAYERYEAFKLVQSSSASYSDNRLSVASSDTPSSPVPSLQPSTSTLSRISSEISEGRPYSSLFNFLGRSRTPGYDGEKKPPLVISGPISGPIHRELMPMLQESSTVGFGTSWASLVDKSALEGIPTSERRRQEAIFELIHTENAYVRNLQLIVEIFYSSMISMLDEKAIKVIFANVEDILLINTTFLSSLEERQKECRLYMDTVGDLLRTHIPNVTAYMEYCVNEGTAIKLLHSMRNSNPELSSHLNRLREDPAIRNLDLSSYLLAPMQRITRYPLLIRQILQYTEVGQDRTLIEQSLQVAENILNHINESIREQEGRERLRTISKDLWVGRGRLDLTAPTRNMGPRRLLKEGIVVKAKSGRRLRAFLCSDVLVLTDENAQALYRMPMPLVELQVKDAPRDDLAFNIIVAYPRGGGNILLRASSVRECQMWLRLVESACRRCRRADEKAALERSLR